MRSHWHAGQHDLRGKKTKLLRCRCCVVRDLRPRVDKAELPRVIAAGVSDYETDHTAHILGMVHRP